MDTRRHVVGGGPNPQTRNTIVVVEDATVAPDRMLVRCAHSDLDFGRLMRTLYPEMVEVVPVKGHPRRALHVHVHPANYDEVVRDFEDPAVTPTTDAEIAHDLLRARRRN